MVMIAFFSIVVALSIVLAIGIWLLSPDWSRKSRIISGSSLIVVSQILVALITNAATEIVCNDFYQSAFSIFLKAVIADVEKNPNDALKRLHEFQKTQSFTYENDGNLLRNVEDFASTAQQ